LEDKETRKTFEILTLKCEYVDDLSHELSRQSRHCSELMDTLTRRYRAAAAAGTLRAGVAPELAALDTCAFLLGLIRMSLLCGARSPAVGRTHELIAMHVQARRAPKPVPRGR
ncbi:MAG TPA: hypothetical protein VFC24_01780, partial [Casimicrobiaceae bacterium]|nr:hypothetical protein [Casimicrobiaceae bacterium]